MHNMSQNKLKVLMCSEASFLNSGFGTYAKEILSRLHKTNKYIIAEFASYGFVNDPRDKSIDWIYYANAVRDNDPRHKEYSSRPDNQFGRWRFEKVLLDFKPDIVIDVRDYWMSSYQALSPLRKFFHWILMPTVDSEPQQEDWIDTFLGADSVFTYSDWGADVLKKQSSGKINYIDTVSPGVDLKTFRIKENKEEIKQKYKLPTDSIIIGSVMRNQKRKLIPELFSTFRSVLDQLEKDNDIDTAKKLYLYIHTSYPDMGWDIPELLKEHRISNKVFFTYICKNCKYVDSSLFNGSSKICSKCHHAISVFPSVADGLDTETLSDIYNTFDLYVQYAICEGFGMPQVEAGACGVPIATVNYSAMCDVINKLEAFAIEPQTRFKELETKAIRVYPDNNQLKEYILDFIKLPSKKIYKLRAQTRKLTEKYYCWDDIAKKWEKHLDYLQDIGCYGKWNLQPQFMKPLPNIDSKQNQNLDVMLHIYQNYLKDLVKIDSMPLLNLLKDADYGFSNVGPVQIKASNIKNLIEYAQTLISNNNHTEDFRSKNLTIEEDFITYAKIKASSV